jgi:calcineurin-like phosphoesterase family protein
MNIEEKLALITEDTWIISDTHFGHRNILDFEPCRLTQMRIDGYNADEHDQWMIDTWNATVKPDDVVLHLGDFAFKPGYYTKEFEEAYEKLKFSDIKHMKNSFKLTKPKSLKEIMEMSFSTKDIQLDKEQFKSLISNYIPENEYYIRYKDLLNGTIILVLGNHDPKPYDNKLNGMEVIDGFYWEQKDILNKVYNPDVMFSGFIKIFRDKKCLFSHYPVFDNDDWDRKNKMIAPRISVLETIFTANECNLNVHGHIHSNDGAFKYSKNVSFERIGFKPIKLSTILV